MAKWQYTKGLHDLGHNNWAYLQPDGSWGWSNAGIIVDGEANLLVDTLFDLKLTQEMLNDMKAAIPAAEKIGILVNTHADGDHTFGNQLVGDARIIATEGTAKDFDRVKPEVWDDLVVNSAKHGRSGAFIEECLWPFEFSNITLTPPTETFTGQLTINVGDKRVELIEVGPAHSLGDTLIYVPADKVIYTGDILFNEGTPIAWYGPVAKWIRACNVILELDVEIVVPGHGPICTKHEVKRMRDYLLFVTDQAKSRYEAGMDYLQAVHDIDLGEYAGWNDAERVVVTIQTLYDDFKGGVRPNRDPMPFFEHMKDLREVLGKGRVHDQLCIDCGRAH